MSDTDATGGSDTEEVTEFKCRKCPGKTFTAAEKDSHRQFHRQQKEGKRRPGPKSKTRTSSRLRETSPDHSEVTLFQPINTSATPKPAKRGRKSGKDVPSGKKIKSRKNYDSDIVGTWSHGTGA